MFGSKPALSLNTNTFGSNSGQPKASNAGFGANPNQGAGVFGQPAQTSTTGGLFGQNPASQPAAGGLFGQASNTATANTTTGLFGQTAQSNPGTSGGLFGQNPATQPPTQPAAGGLFGQASTSNAATSLFGQPAQSNTGTSGGLFGQKPATQPAAGGLFGQSTQSNTGTGGGLFGQKPATQPATGGLFGQTTQSNTGISGGLFGQPAATTSTSGGLFGQQAQTTGATGGLFGQSNTGGLFGQQATNQSGLFGQTATNAGMFGQQQMQPVQPAQPGASDYIKYVADCWDTKNPSCQFKHYFYNLVHPSEVHLYQPEPNEDRVLYDQAQMNNPDPSCMVPVLAVGFEGIKKRVEIQEEQLKIQKEKIGEFHERLESLQSTHTVSTVMKIEACKRKQRQIVHKVLQLMKSVQILRNKGYSLRAEEEALMTRLASMDRDIAKPSVFRGRLNELWAHLQQLSEVNHEQYFVSDPQGLSTVCQTLEGISKGLGRLTEVVQEDDDTISGLNRGYQESFAKY